MSFPLSAKRQADRARSVMETRVAEKAARRAALVATRGRMATMGPASTTAVPKTEPQRNRALLDMAKDRPCLMCLRAGIAICTPSSTVAAHSNWAVHGKSGARKADDMYSVWLGDTHHRWLDQGTALAADKKAAFMAAHIEQVDRWRCIATSPSEPERFRSAAKWALDRLNATPTFDLENAP